MFSDDLKIPRIEEEVSSPIRKSLFVEIVDTVNLLVDRHNMLVDMLNEQNNPYK